MAGRLRPQSSTLDLRIPVLDKPRNFRAGRKLRRQHGLRNANTAKRLDSNWGIVDVDDCVNGARYLAQQGLVDGERSVITGGSAGGFTVLAALTFRDYFRGGGESLRRQRPGCARPGHA